ncbi:hypothetical protein EIN_052740 [Entamoeba invadens IP1]|uniref:hypothetical protein n=1 Tax=Entamoeba invadens IP1 TaxID=370355 RepID=UPI0002C3DA76|nr:hypothetical protein EIN_052740 [Entamoeba invadens IP1]ELP93059.1 hypothetical protein EIN_052740 [Entamoeba invadens IP1]|eukprot:XP_004259830.1 hypothetical protein EIN_052740 [Entamoeba invadens IP1]
MSDSNLSTLSAQVSAIIGFIQKQQISFQNELALRDIKIESLESEIKNLKTELLELKNSKVPQEVKTPTKIEKVKALEKVEKIEKALILPSKNDETTLEALYETKLKDCLQTELPVKKDDGTTWKQSYETFVAFPIIKTNFATNENGVYVSNQQWDSYSTVKVYKTSEFVKVSYTPKNYCEITLNTPFQKLISFGLVDNPNYTNKCCIGKEKESLGMTSDGYFSWPNGQKKKATRVWGVGDVIGVGTDPDNKLVYFTFNGRVIMKVQVTFSKWYVALQTNNWIGFEENFGRDPFIYDVIH